MTGAELEVLDGELVDDDHLPAVQTDTNVQQRAPLPHEQLRELFLLSKANTNTRDAYRRDLGEWFTFCAQLGGDPLAAEQHHCDLWREHLLHGRHQTRYGIKDGFPPTTVARRMSGVSSFYTYCVRKHRALVDENPFQHVERPLVDDESATQSLNLDEARRLLSTAEASGLRTYALISVLLHCGLRVSEVCAADCSDLVRKNDGPAIRVKRKGGKKQNIDLPAQVDTALKEYRGDRRGPLFLGDKGARITRQQVAYLLKMLLASAGLDTGVTPHGLRHTAVTLLRDSGQDIEDVADLVGHSSLNTTKRYDRGRGRRSTVEALATALSGETVPEVDAELVRAVAAALGADPSSVDPAAVALAMARQQRGE
ncbi:tyrosine-type recombinase/integrase [Streptomyces decoyicus]|uniref:tyrosine-type recombinase/integrase n=1 Tax=Streptomyces decoyicus TaxID=249567 RepID=UPI002F90F9E7